MLFRKRRGGGGNKKMGAFIFILARLFGFLSFFFFFFFLFISFLSHSLSISIFIYGTVKKENAVLNEISEGKKSRCLSLQAT